MSRFIVFEGLDGSGKSSLMRLLLEELGRRGIAHYQTREPGGTVVGDALREIILRKAAEVPSPRTELLLYEASRAQHVDLVIRPRLQKGEWVICDRYAASSIAFQASGRAIPESKVEWLNNFATDGERAHLTVLLDLPIEEARKRRSGRSSAGGEAEDRIEAEADDFHQKVRDSFLAQAKAAPQEWLVLSALATPAELFAQLLAEFRRRQWLD